MTVIDRPIAVPAFRSILYATDFSPSSQAALPFLRALALRYSATVHVIHVLPAEAWSSAPTDTLPALLKNRKDAEVAMRGLIAGESFRGIPCTAAVERGELWEVLSSALGEKQVDLIVLGTHGRRGLLKMVLGSSAEEVFRRANCPVLTVGPHTTDRGRAEVAGAPVLFATDFSPGSEHALAYARSLAHATRSPLLLVHAVSPAVTNMPASMDSVAVDPRVSAEIAAEIEAAALRKLEEMLSAEEVRTLNPEFVVQCASAAELILGTAEKKQAGMIVMGAHKASAHSVASHLPWATASEVVRAASCPVLTVRS